MCLLLCEFLGAFRGTNLRGQTECKRSVFEELSLLKFGWRCASVMTSRKLEPMLIRTSPSGYTLRSFGQEILTWE